MIRTCTTFLALLAGIATAPAALAQMHHDHGGTSATPMQAAPASRAAMAEGEVRAVDRAKGTITLRHGPLTALDMPPMTMTFVARQPALLAGVKEGDRVRFTPELGKDGTLVVTTLQVVKG